LERNKGEKALWCWLGSHSRTGERLDSFNLQSLVELHIHGLGSLCDLQVPHTTSERCAGRKSCLTNPICEKDGEMYGQQASPSPGKKHAACYNRVQQNLSDVLMVET